jgi:hypothetical protein
MKFPTAAILLAVTGLISPLVSAAPISSSPHPLTTITTATTALALQHRAALASPEPFNFFKCLFRKECWPKKKGGEKRSVDDDEGVVGPVEEDGNRGDDEEDEEDDDEHEEDALEEPGAPGVGSMEQEHGRVVHGEEGEAAGDVSVRKGMEEVEKIWNDRIGGENDWMNWNE